MAIWLKKASEPRFVNRKASAFTNGLDFHPIGICFIKNHPAKAVNHGRLPRRQSDQILYAK